eukprot:300057-Rhodomonas_salina.1
MTGRTLGSLMWDYDSRTLMFTLAERERMRAGEERTVRVPVSMGIRIPTGGIRGDEEGFSMSTSAAAGPVLRSPVTLQKIGGACSFVSA